MVSAVKNARHWLPSDGTDYLYFKENMLNKDDVDCNKIPQIIQGLHSNKAMTTAVYS